MSRDKKRGGIHTAFVKNKMDLTQGSILKKMLIFAIPIILTNLFQQFYQVADMMVVGNFAQDSTKSLAAVGATTSVTGLCLNLFIGLGVGVNVVCARLFGAKREEELRRAMHTSVILAVLCGVGIGVFGLLFSRPLLEWIGAPAEVIEEAALYMKIIFLGQTGSIVYNFGASILRSHGDTKRPMYILLVTGLVNVAMNFFLVYYFHLDSTGVALATVAAYYLSAMAVLWILFSPRGEYRLRISRLSLGKEVLSIASVGIPSGLNSIMFSIPKVIIVSALNTLGATVLAADSSSHNVETILYQVIAGFCAACVSFVAQNYGAQNFRRIDRLWRIAMLISLVFFALVGVVLYPIAEYVMKLFADQDQVLALGAVRIHIVCCTYILYVFPEICIAFLRGLGKTTVSSALNILCVCIPRILWITCVFFTFRTGEIAYDYALLLLCYPVSWALSGVAQCICYRCYRRTLRPKEN